MKNLIKLAEIYGSEAIVYNGSKAPPDLYIDLIVNNKLVPGMGSGFLYGKGVYTTYNLPGTATGIGTYGDFVYKLKVNLYGFISFNPDITKKIYGEDLTPSQQYKKIYGRKDYIFKELIALESKERFSEFSSDLADPASLFLRGRVKGLIFTGRNDGDVAVIYDPLTIVPIAWKKTWDRSWSSFNKDQIKPAIGRGISGSFEKSKYDEVDVSKDRVAKESISVLLNFHGDKLGKRETESINYLIANAPTTFLLNFSERDWVRDYLKAAIDRSLSMISSIDFVEYFRNKAWFDSNSGSAVKSVAEQDAFYFLKDYVKETWAKEYIPTAVKSLAKRHPYSLLTDFANEPWAQPYIELAKNKRNNMSKEDQDPISPTASNRSAKILKLSKALLSLGHIKEMSATRSLTTGNHKIASDEKISGKFKLESLNESQKEELYGVFEESYKKTTGQAWSSGLFFSRASSWTFYGIVGGLASGVVAIREQFGGLNKLVAIAGNPRGVLLGIKALKEDKSSDPIWGAISLEMIPMVERFGFKAATEEELKGIAKNLPNYIRREIGDINPDGSFKMNIAEVGETTKKFVYNDVYGDMFCQK